MTARSVRRPAGPRTRPRRDRIPAAKSALSEASTGHQPCSRLEGETHVHPNPDQPPGFDTGTPPPRPPWWRRKLIIIRAGGLALILAASIGAAAAGGGSHPAGHVTAKPSISATATPQPISPTGLI